MIDACHALPTAAPQLRVFRGIQLIDAATNVLQRCTRAAASGDSSVCVLAGKSMPRGLGVLPRVVIAWRHYLAAGVSRFC